MMKTASGIISIAPVMYETRTESFIPKMLNSQTRTISAPPITCPRPRPSASPVLNVQSEPENHCAWISEPTTRPKIERTLDQANQ
jgi:hypothetical protein